ncbi:unnamed protein product [Adineta steineri]|uniref:Uncharacterized protein n=1 Tax=Adineta steineri TaxID=433720 RepID=A0A816CLU8_9BILA|nr:unnamed protein product [Adineta steineri]CAF1625068.1 unnamed protein product [Adineta steineri]
MNFHYSKNTTHRPQNTSSHFNEDARCDNEVNLILEKNYNQKLFEQSIYPEQSQQPQQQSSVVVNQTDQYYFMPIREQSSTMALHTNNNSNVVDNTSISTSNHDKPSKHDLFDYSTTTSKTSSFASTSLNKGNNNYHLDDTDLAGLFASSIVSISRSTTAIDNKNDMTDNPNTLDDFFFQQVSEIVCSPQQNVGPPPGFENFHFDASSSDSLTTVSSINAANVVQSQVSTSDTINFSQLLPSINVDTQQQTSIGGNVRSSSSSHSSYTSDDQTIFFPMAAHPYSSPSQIFPINTSVSAATNSINSNAKPFIPNSLSNHEKQFNSYDKNRSISPKPTIMADTDTILKGGDATPSHVFASPTSFFSNSHADFAPAKPSSNKTSSTNRQSSSSTSSSTSSSIDEALSQLSQQHSHARAQTTNKLFSDESLSIFNFPQPKTTSTHIDKQQRAVCDNINFLASMAAGSTPVTPESPWQKTTHSSSNLQPKIQSIRQQQTILPQSPATSSSFNMQELQDSLNELCYRGFDELNALIQEQRWVQNYLNLNSSSLPSSNSPLVNINGASSCSSRILIVPEYFIFKCKKVEVTACHVYDVLATGRPELRLRDLMFVFKSWRETIANAEFVHQEEEVKLRLNTEHFPSYYMNETILQAAFERVYLVIRQLVSMTQQARAAFQYATLNVFQMSSRQTSQTSSNLSQSSNSLALAQLQAMQQPKSSSTHRIGGSTRATP